MFIAYQYRRIICNYRTNALNSFYPALLKDMQECDNIVAQLFQLLSKRNGSQAFPFDDVFCASFINFNDYNSIIAKYTLAMLENHLNSKEKIQLANISVEHIMPQVLDPTWKSDLGKDCEQVHIRWKDTFGNLTLTGINGQLGNRGFVYKRDKYKHSNFALSHEIAESDIWNGTSIERRAEQLATRAKEIWPVPETMNDSLGTRRLLDFDEESPIMDDIEVTGLKPRYFIFRDKKHIIDTWKKFFVEILKQLYEYDSYAFQKFLAHEVAIKNHLAEPLDSSHIFRDKPPLEICPGYLTETHGSAQALFWFTQIAVEQCEREDDIYFSVRPSSSKQVRADRYSADRIVAP